MGDRPLKFILCFSFDKSFLKKLYFPSRNGIKGFSSAASSILLRSSSPISQYFKSSSINLWAQTFVGKSWGSDEYIGTWLVSISQGSNLGGRSSDPIVYSDDYGSVGSQILELLMRVSICISSDEVSPWLFSISKLLLVVGRSYWMLSILDFLWWCLFFPNFLNPIASYLPCFEFSILVLLSRKSLKRCPCSWNLRHRNGKFL